ncbi:hypothetical protein CkaCkLH20_13018 [Colletotrichum karsti]|uniref:Transcription factor Cys6 n=1 Tax=Colletotrichum karsti TaxID=1095194 RepID=A0A9P6LDT1_9PEZI|nr:uncharacterized protein CkaCkLH20_13018 [Colletotrichum karsti]KAF9869533.1 hypothetical protein CkaCkLH20_13018 [Colletotrichum karsti]
MAAMSRTNSVGALQGFSICQPVLGASLQFYPALGTQQLDDLINAFVPGTASIKEKRATVSMDFFEYSQLTGETFKYYPVYTQPSSAESSPVQDSGYVSNFVSPVISDWSWSQSTPSSASVSTPASATQEIAPTKSSKKAAAPTPKSQSSDFSHLPGMKIMTKDGRDVTNSASRGCKTKEQRDHAHLMRIIKACDACKKKKVRCDPSHKKRTAAQTQPAAAPARLAKKAKTSTAKDSRAVTERQPQQTVSSTSLFTDPIFTGLEIPDMPLELPESWESFVQFDDEPANASPFDYDFFSDPEGHLSPHSRQSPASPSMVFSQPQAVSRIPQNLLSSQSFVEDTIVRPPTLPYMDATAPANNYVDFNLYSPEPSFLDDDAALITDIGSAAGKELITTPQRRGLAQDRRSSYLHTDDRALALPDDLSVDRGTTVSPQFAEDPQGVDRGQRLPPSGEGRNTFAEDRSVPQNAVGFRTSHSRLPANAFAAPAVQSPLMTDDAQNRTRSLWSSSGIARTQLQSVNVPSTNAGDVSRNASPAQPSPSQVPLASVASFACFSTSLGELSYYATTDMATPGDGSNRATGVTSTTPTSTGYLQATGVTSQVSRGTSAPLSSRSSIADIIGVHGERSAIATFASNGDVIGVDGEQSAIATFASDGIVSACRSLAGKPSATQFLLFAILLVATLGTVVTSLEAQALTGGLLQIAFGLAMFKAYSHSSLHGSRPQQSRLSTTPKPQGFSDGARLLSCVSTRLRHTRRQNQDAHSRSRPAVGSRLLSFAQGFR